MKYVVGYRPDERGADAVTLAGVIAKTQGAQLHLSMLSTGLRSSIPTSRSARWDSFPTELQRAFPHARPIPLPTV